MFEKFARRLNRRKLTDPKYDYLFAPYDGDEVVVFDTETTGLDPKKDDIISIGAVKVRGNRILSESKFQRFVKPKGKLNETSIKVHMIRECDLHDAEELDGVLEDFLEFIGNRTLVGYYLEFDIAMINKYLKKRLGITLPNKQIEVSAIYHDKKIGFIPQGIVDLRFDSILKDLNLPVLGKHDALNDAIMTALMYIKLQNVSKLPT